MNTENTPLSATLSDSSNSRKESDRILTRSSDSSQDNLKQLELENSYKEVCALIASTSDKDFLLDFFNCLFTKSERKNIAERWLLVKEIEAGVPQREIAKKYNMSLCKITRGSKELKRKDSAFLKMLEIAKKDN